MAILISIKPEHCCKILNKDKILEIRTTCPAEWKKYLDGKTNVKPKPCKVYIYETKGKILIGEHFERSKSKENLYFGGKAKYIIKKDYYFGRGKVIAVFTLNKVNKFDYEGLKFYGVLEDVLKHSCLTDEELCNYIQDGIGYGWKIDNLIIYDTPKELGEFGLKRTFQSWGYIK